MKQEPAAGSASEIVLRQATLADAAALGRLEAQLFDGEAWSQTLLEAEILAHTDRCFLVATPVADTKLVVGYGEIWTGDGQGDADVLTIATAPNWQRQGIGRHLLKALITKAWAAGCRNVLLEVRLTNTSAQELYKTHGFESLGIRRNYYQNPLEDALVMRLEGERRSPGVVGSEVL